MREPGMWGQAVRTNWHLLIVLALIVVGAVALALRPAPEADAAAAVELEVQTTLGSPGTPEKSRWAKPSRSEQAEEAIEKYKHEIDYNAGSVETPNNLYRLANVYYSELHDYEKASLYYLTLLQDYPDYVAMQTVFANLMMCYEKLGQNEMKRNVLERMMKYFGEGTQEYLFAEKELNGM